MRRNPASWMYTTPRVGETKMRRLQSWHETSRLSASRSGELKFSAEQLKGLTEQIVGKVVLPQEPSYQAARASFMNAFQHFPQIVVYCQGFADVVACIRFAKEVGLKPVCRAGGHSTAGYSLNDDMVVDVSGINYVKVDAEREVAWVGAGAQFAQVNANLELFGLHIPGGGCDTVAVAGYMQGGGYGFTAPMFGMNCDQVLSFQMALADGRIVNANQQENPDLFWAVRGGTGNNFGVLLEIEYRLQRLQDLWGFGFRWPLGNAKESANAAKALHVWQNNFTGDSLPPDFGSQGLLVHTRSSPTNPREPFFVIRGMFRGSESGCLKALEPLFRSAPSAKKHRDVWRRGTYRALNQYLFNYPTELPPDVPDSCRSLAKSHIVARRLTLPECREIIDLYQHTGSPDNCIGMEAYGGAINAIAPDSNAFWHRRAAMDVFCFFFWLYEDARRKAEANIEEFDRVVQPLGNGHSYQNYPNRTQKDFGTCYFGGNLPRLLKVKKAYDPANFFSFPQGLGEIPQRRAMSS
jgi:FAD/FMN-containing dehydrogenase